MSSKARYYYQKYKEDYHAEWPCVRKSSKGDYHAFCTVCSIDISVKSGGRNDVLRHIVSNKHKETVKARADTRKGIQGYFRSMSDDGGITKAEALFTGFLVEHNLPLASSDHVGPLMREMFPDSQIAAKYACVRTKTSAMIRAMSQNTTSLIAEKARKSPYSLATDGSNDGGSDQLYPILLTYFDDMKGRVTEALLSLPALTDGASTGENIFKLLDGELSKEKIPWSNCISFVADNASVMLGRHKGVAAFIQKEHAECYIVGCPCHMAHNTAEKASKSLPIAIDELLVDIFYYLDKSSKRQKALKALQILCDTGVRKILKHGSTRWLSLGICIDRLLSQWQPLQLFFKEEVKCNMSSGKSTSSRKQTPSKSLKGDSSLSVTVPKEASSAGKTAKFAASSRSSMSTAASSHGSSAEKTAKFAAPSRSSLSTAASSHGSAAEKLARFAASSRSSMSTAASRDGSAAEKPARFAAPSRSSVSTAASSDGSAAEKSAKFAAPSRSSVSTAASSDGSAAEKPARFAATSRSSVSTAASSNGSAAEKPARFAASSRSSVSTAASSNGSAAEKPAKFAAPSRSSVSTAASSHGSAAEKPAKFAAPRISSISKAASSHGSLAEESADCTSAKKNLKRKSSGHKSTLPAKRPLLKAGTKDAPSLQESRLARIHRLMISPQTKLYCYFLRYANNIFDDINLLLQREEPCLHILHRQLNKVFRDMLLRFVKPSVIVECSDVKEVPYGQKANQKSDEDLMIGKDAKDYIRSMMSSEGDFSLQLTKVDTDYFYLSVRKYYESACGYALKTWPLDVKFLKEAEVIDVTSRRKVSFFSLQYFAERYPCILGTRPDAEDDLEIEFAQYQVEDFEEVPEVLDATVRIDKKWHVISEMNDANGCRKYPLLSTVMKGLLVIPHSNAACERVFSIVRKNKTDFRGSMNLETLQSLLVEKISSSGVPCYQRQYSKDLLSKMKQATYQSLQARTSTASSDTS